MTSDELKILIEEIGPINGEIDAIVRLSEVLCTVGSEDVDIDIEFDAPANKLMFSVELGAPRRQTHLTGRAPGTTHRHDRRVRVPRHNRRAPIQGSMVRRVR
jgi:hypothetical protein